MARLARRGFKAISEARAAEGDLPGAVAMAWRWAEMEPLEDEAQHTLIELLARSGDRSGALEQYEAYRGRLERELEVEPLEITQELVDRIKSGDAIGPTSRGTPTTEGRVAETGPGYVARSRTRSVGADPDGSLVDKLRSRHVFHVGAVYLAVAWLTIQFADTLADRGLLPNWVFPVVLFLLALGLPMALIVAWAIGSGAGQVTEVAGVWPGWVERVRTPHLLGFLGVLVLGLLVGLGLMRVGVIGAGDLEESRVLVYPLAVTPEGNEPEGLKAATWIGYTLESTGQLKYIDGWWELDNVQRAAVELVTPRTAREQARSLRAAYYIRGRVELDADSLRIVAELHDVRRGREIDRVTAAGPRHEPWLPYGSEDVARTFIAKLLSEGTPIELAAASDTPQAVIAFLEGENAYRRARFTEALGHYQSALELDPSFTLAALKGTMAAGWEHETDLAIGFIEQLGERSALLEPSRAQLAAGLEDYWAGRADPAVEHLGRALLIDPDFVEAWAHLGETYTHLLPDTARLDSLGRNALLQTRRREPEFRPVLYHLIEFAIRAGELDSARVYLQEFRQQNPAAYLLRRSELKLECAAQSPQMIDWSAIAADDAATVHAVGESLARAGARTDCARAAWGALLAADLAGEVGEAYRFASLMALQSLLAAEGRFDELTTLFESQDEFAEQAGDLLLIDANAGAPFETIAERQADSIRADWSAGNAASYKLWMLGVHEFRQGRAERVRLIADSLAARAADTIRLDSLLAEIMAARATLTDGDTATAVELLYELGPTKKRSDHWYPWETLAAEKMLLARLLLELERHSEAIQVAATVDAPARPPSDLIYLPASLVIRARAARALGDTDLERESRERLARLGRTDLIAALDN